MLGRFFSLPLQLVCQLAVVGNNGSGNATILAVDKQLPKQPMVLPDGYTAFPDIGVAYKYHPHEISWDMARKRCLESGGTLVELDTFEKLEYAMSMKNANKAVWVGIHRLFNDTEWTSARTGRKVTHILWASTSNDATKTNQCMGMFYHGRGLGAFRCNDTYHSICEIPLPIE